jgi:hypothetical protein
VTQGPHTFLYMLGAMLLGWLCTRVSLVSASEHRCCRPLDVCLYEVNPTEVVIRGDGVDGSGLDVDSRDILRLPRQAETIGWDLIISWKQNQRDLYQSAIQLLAPPRAIPRLLKNGTARPTRSSSGTRRVYLFSGDYPQPVRVVRSEELLTQKHYRPRQLQPETTAHEWLSITTIGPPGISRNPSASTRS